MDHLRRLIDGERPCYVALKDLVSMSACSTSHWFLVVHMVGFTDLVGHRVFSSHPLPYLPTRRHSPNLPAVDSLHPCAVTHYHRDNEIITIDDRNRVIVRDIRNAFKSAYPRERSASEESADLQVLHARSLAPSGYDSESATGTSTDPELNCLLDDYETFEPQETLELRGVTSPPPPPAPPRARPTWSLGVLRDRTVPPATQDMPDSNANLVPDNSDVPSISDEEIDNLSLSVLFGPPP